VTRSRGRYQVRDAKPITIAETGREPDIALVRRQAYRQGHPTPADVFLVIEFANSSLEKDTDESATPMPLPGLPTTGSPT